jgi:hypothetical protein
MSTEFWTCVECNWQKFSSYKKLELHRRTPDHKKAEAESWAKGKGCDPHGNPLGVKLAINTIGPRRTIRSAGFGQSQGGEKKEEVEKDWTVYLVFEGL